MHNGIGVSGIPAITIRLDAHFSASCIIRPSQLELYPWFLHLLDIHGVPLTVNEIIGPVRRNIVLE